MTIRLLPLCLAVAVSGYAQIPEAPKAPPSPNTFSFMQVKKIPVTWFSGLPSVAVPLHSIQYKTQSIDMALTFNTAGFRPDQHAPVTGTGTALKVAGVVTREVKGLQDEYRFTFLDGVNPGNSATYNLGWLNRPGASPYYVYGIDLLTDGAYHWVDKMFGTSPTGAPEWVKYPWPIPYRGSFIGVSCLNTPRNFKFRTWPHELNTDYEGTKDVQRDEFSFSMFGYSGKFYFKNSTEIEVVADKKFKVTKIANDIDLPASLLQPNSDPMAGATCLQTMLGTSPYDISGSYPKTIAGFTIIAEDGTAFSFGNHQPDQDAIEYSISENYRPSQSGHGSQSYTDTWVANAWHLTAVRFPDGRMLNYDYERGEYTRTLYKGEQLVSVVQNSTDPGCGNATSLPWPSYQLTSGKITSPVYLQRLYSEMVEATFSYSNTNESNALTVDAVQNFKWKKLDTIRIKDMEGMTYKWAFTYDPLSNWSQRLFLQKIEKFDPLNNATGERYLFKYNNHLTLPNYNQSQNDHWQFWNGAGTSSIMGLSNAQINTVRSPSLSHASAGVLKEIVYPTGGYQRFEYELNSYRKKVKYERMNGVDSLSSNFSTGGLRIASIETVDTVSGIRNKARYYYVSSYNPSLTPAQNAALPSSGVQNVNDYIYHWSDVIGTFYGPTWWANCLRDLKFSISCQQPLQALHDDYHVGYSTVVEVRQDSAYTVRTFTNHDNGYPDDSVIQSINPFPSPYRHFSSRAKDRGKPLFEGKYTKTGKLVQSKETEYVIVPAYAGGPAKTFMEDWSNTLLDSYNGNGQLTGWTTVPATYCFSDLYKEYTYGFFPSRITSRQYQDNANTYVTTIQELEYTNPAHWQPTVVRNIDSDGKILEQRTKYAEDFPSTFVTDRFLYSHWKTQTIERTTLIKDSAAAPYKVTGGILNEFALYPNLLISVPMNKWELQIESPFLLSAMTTTVPVTYSYSGTNWLTAWTKDPRYKLSRFTPQWDSMYNVLEQRPIDGNYTRTLMGYQGLRAVGKVTIGQGLFYHAAYTSFETEKVRTIFDYANVKTIEDCTDWIFMGTRDTTVAYTGKTSFSGRILMRAPVFWAAKIDVAVRIGGNLPFFETYNATTGVFTPFSMSSPTLLKEKDGWRIYRYAYGSGSIRLAINTNGNLIDDVRMYPTSISGEIKTNTYVNGRITEVMDKEYNRIKYQYDNIGRVIRLRDDDNNIIEEREYKFRTPIN